MALLSVMGVWGEAEGVGTAGVGWGESLKRRN